MEQSIIDKILSEAGLSISILLLVCIGLVRLYLMERTERIETGKQLLDLSLSTLRVNEGMNKTLASIAQKIGA